MAKKSTTKTVVTLKHEEAKRKNIPTAEYNRHELKNRNDIDNSVGGSKHRVGMTKPIRQHTIF